MVSILVAAELGRSATPDILHKLNASENMGQRPAPCVCHDRCGSRSKGTRNAYPTEASAEERVFRDIAEARF